MHRLFFIIPYFDRLRRRSAALFAWDCAVTNFCVGLNLKALPPFNDDFLWGRNRGLADYGCPTLLRRMRGREPDWFTLTTDPRTVESGGLLPAIIPVRSVQGSGNSIGRLRAGSCELAT